MDCKNCGTTLISENKFCNTCGAKVIENRLTVGHLFEDFKEKFLDIDNTFLRTFISLFKRPDDVINGYIIGTRKKYINVLNYIALAITISGLQFFILKKFFPDVMQFPENLSDGNQMGTSIMSFILEYNSFIYIILIPLYGLLSKIVFNNIKKYNYVEHIVIMGYIQSHLSIALFIPGIILSIFGFNYFDYNYIFVVVMILYNAYCFKKLYELSLKRIIVKTFVFFGIGLLFYILMIILFMIGMLTYLYLTGGMEEFMKNQEAAAYLVSSAINWTS
jgi:hypothetical protein